MKTVAWIIGTLVGLFVIMSIGLVAATDPNKNTRWDYERVVKSQLRDPDSAEFQNEDAYDNIGMCGQVNAKNGFGGYSGFKHFAILNNGVFLIEDSDPTSLQMVFAMCDKIRTTARGEK